MFLQMRGSLLKDAWVLQCVRKELCSNLSHQTMNLRERVEE